MIINNHLTGSKYKESGKIDIPRFFLFLVIGYIISSLVGIGYGLLSELNPFIYLNFILLGIAVLGVVLAASLFKMAGKLRNRYVAILLAIFFGFVCIYNAWSAIYAQSAFSGMIFQLPFSGLAQVISMRELSIGKIGRNGAGLGEGITSIIYLVEMLIMVVVPAIFVGRNPSYYCEECDKPMDENEFHFGLTNEEVPAVESNVKQGKLKVLFELTTYAEKELNLSLNYIQCTSHECPECHKLVYSADSGSAKMEKDKTSFKKKESLASNLYGSRKD
jgi:hypothetical protein